MLISTVDDGLLEERHLGLEIIARTNVADSIQDF